MGQVIPFDHKSEVTTIANLWWLKRRDGFVLGLTDHDQPIELDGVIYRSGGFAPSAVQSTSDLSVDNLESEGVLETRQAPLPGDEYWLDPTGEYISDFDLVNGRWDKAEAMLMQVDYEHLDAGARIMRYGVVGNASISKGQFKTEMRGLLQYLQQNMGVLVTEACRFELGDSMCRVNLADHTTSGEVTQKLQQHSFGDAARTEDPTIYAQGTVIWLTGPSAGVRVNIKTSGEGKVVLQEAMIDEPQVGDTYTISKGCNKLLKGDCKTKFDNCARHGGFDQVPGRDALSSLQISAAR